MADPGLIAAILGDIATTPAALPGFALTEGAAALGQAALRPAGGSVVAGLLPGTDPAQAARLDWYAAATGLAAMRVTLADGAAAVALAAGEAGADPWDAARWQWRAAAVAAAAAGDVMRLMGKRPAAALRARYAQMLVRGAARLRAAAPGGAALRRVAAPGDVTVEDWREPYARYFAVEEVELRHRRFDGTAGPRILRAVFVSGDAVTVLPYDPLRDRVMVVEQFRPAPFLRGDANPWLIEAIAGRIDPFETAEEAARREAAEEAGLTLGALHLAGEYYPSPGAKTEYLWSYVALADLPDTAAGLGGIEGEGEDIRAHVLPFDRLMALVEAKEGANGPLILTAHWLARHRARLRGA
jgi:nudix-type nucleoside diphosphatase (YffH/AdpP family)